MASSYFLDTNVLVYSLDPADKKKQRVAKALVREALVAHTGIISYQIVQETLALLTGKFKHSMSRSDLAEYLEDVLLPLCEIYPDEELYRAALAISAETEYRFYDSLVVSSAKVGGCNILYSEDLQDGRTISGVRIVNPFASART